MSRIQCQTPPESREEYEARVKAEQDRRLSAIYGAEWDNLSQEEKDAEWELAKHLAL